MPAQTPTNKSLLGSVLKSRPEGLADPGPDGLWGVASVQEPDSVKDIVVIDGLSTDEYHSPPQRHLKILAQHKHTTPDGRPTVIGRVEEFVRSEVNGKPALLFRMSWAKDGQGNLMPLAKEYKDLYDGGYLDSFSVGMMVREAQAVKGGGFELRAATLHEISAVSVPALVSANALKEMGERLGAAEATYGAIEKMSEALDRIEKLAASLNKRLDDIEDTLATANAQVAPAEQAAGQEQGDPKDPQAPAAELSPSIKSALQALFRAAGE